MKNTRLNCRFCQKQLPATRLVDVCIRCASPWKRPLQQGQKRAAIESHQAFGLIKPRRKSAANSAKSNSILIQQRAANKRP